LFAAILMLLGVIGGLVAGEIWARGSKPMPPTPVVRGNGLHTIDNVPVWETSTSRENRACVEQHPERLRVLFFGSSISYGFQLRPEQAFTSLLEKRLNAARPNPGFCVLNFSQVSFTSQQKLAVASVEVPRYRPALVLWEGWNEFAHFVMLGGSAYDLRGYALGPGGFPGIRGIPDGLNQYLFLHSRLFEYLTLVLGRRDMAVDEQKLAQDRLDRLAAMTEAVGGKLAVYACPALDRPFTESTHLPNGTMDTFVQKHHVPRYFLRHELAGQDYQDLRMDPCCHFNAKGQEALAPIFERIVLDTLDGKEPPAFSDE
jgi:hypothetical protein